MHGLASKKHKSTTKPNKLDSISSENSQLHHHSKSSAKSKVLYVPRQRTLASSENTAPAPALTALSTRSITNDSSTVISKNVNTSRTNHDLKSHGSGLPLATGGGSLHSLYDLLIYHATEAKKLAMQGVVTSSSKKPDAQKPSSNSEGGLCLPAPANEPTPSEDLLSHLNKLLTGTYSLIQYHQSANPSIPPLAPTKTTLPGKSKSTPCIPKNPAPDLNRHISPSMTSNRKRGLEGESKMSQSPLASKSHSSSLNHTPLQTVKPMATPPPYQGEQTTPIIKPSQLRQFYTPGNQKMDRQRIPVQSHSSPLVLNHAKTIDESFSPLFLNQPNFLGASQFPHTSQTPTYEPPSTLQSPFGISLPFTQSTASHSSLAFPSTTFSSQNTASHLPPTTQNKAPLRVSPRKLNKSFDFAQLESEEDDEEDEDYEDDYDEAEYEEEFEDEGDVSIDIEETEDEDAWTSDQVGEESAQNDTESDLVSDKQEDVMSLKHGMMSILVPSLDLEMQQRLDEVFFSYLARLCSDVEAVDSKGDKIHQTLTARKVDKLSFTDFYSFKFRITSFCRGFRDELIHVGYTEEVVPEKIVRDYLWGQRYILRFNTQGKRPKSNGHFVWIVEARKTEDGGWIFKEFDRKIVGPDPSPVAYVGIEWVYTPEIYDPQLKKPVAEYYSPCLPPWLKWKNKELRGIPRPMDVGRDHAIQVVAEYRNGGTLYSVERLVELKVIQP